MACTSGGCCYIKGEEWTGTSVSRVTPEARGSKMTVQLAHWLIWGCFLTTTQTGPVSQLEKTDPTYTEVANLVTKVSPIKRAYIIYDTLRIDHPLALAQTEATIDALATKLSSLRYATTLENLQPLTVVSQEVVLTLFQTVLPLSTSLQACKTLQLEPLTLANLPIALKTSLPILLHDEISIGTDSVLCISVESTLREEECLSNILNKTKHLLPFQRTQELRNYHPSPSWRVVDLSCTVLPVQKVLSVAGVLPSHPPPAHKCAVFLSKRYLYILITEFSG